MPLQEQQHILDRHRLALEQTQQLGDGNLKNLRDLQLFILGIIMISLAYMERNMVWGL